MAWTTPSTWASGDWNIQIRDNMNYMFSNLPPIGSVIPFAGSDADLPDISTGWIPCDGRSLPTIGTYAALHAIIGYIYGGSGGSFLIPNTGGRAVFGVGYAGMGNSINHNVDEGDARGTNHLIHSHGMMDPTNGNSNALIDSETYGLGGNHNHAFQDGDTSHGHSFVASGNRNVSDGGVSAAAATHNHGFAAVNNNHDHNFAEHDGHNHSVQSVISAGSTSDSHEGVDMRPPYLGMYYIIRYV